jgi:5'-methylthioadenosine phosphorylase
LSPDGRCSPRTAADGPTNSASGSAREAREARKTRKTRKTRKRPARDPQEKKIDAVAAARTWGAPHALVDPNATAVLRAPLVSPRKIIGVLGGSGLYEMAGLSSVREVTIETPFGAPSDAYIVGELGDVRLVFLPRHGRGHRFLPGEINYAANIHGMKQLGVEYILSVSAVGSLREHIRPGDVVLPDQFIDRTRGSRRSTFYGSGVVGHVSFADPICGTLHDVLVDVAQGERGDAAGVHTRGTYVVMEGPAFSTRAESHLYRSWGADVIGMTNLPEAKLAREAELCYATVALPTDYDCWRDEEEPVSVDAVVAVLKRNVDLARRIVRSAAERIAAMPPRTCGCASASRFAVMTAPDQIPAEAYARLELIIGRYLPRPARTA